jgi:hypothetical protein
MMNTPTSPLVTIQFGNLDTFCEELAARGPSKIVGELHAQ